MTLRMRRKEEEITFIKKFRFLPSFWSCARRTFMLMKCINKVLKLSRPSLAHGSKLENFQRKTSTIILRADQCSGVIQEMAWVTDTSTVQVIHLLKKYTDRHNSLTLFFGTKVNYCFAVLLLIAYFLSFWSSAKRSERNEIYKASVSLSILHCGLKYRGKSRESSPQKWNIYI